MPSRRGDDPIQEDMRMVQAATTTVESSTHMLKVPSAELAYDVRRSDGTTEPILFLIGSPMGAAGFGTLASYFPDRTVVTYAPRGAERSHRTDGGDRNTTEEQADDLHRLITELGGGPVDLFGSSGGAVNGLALVERHPEQVRTLVAHEPPLASVLEDRDQALKVTEAIHDTYLRDGFGRGMAHFIAAVMHKGPFPAGFSSQPGPDPSMFGMPTEDDGKRDDILLGQNIISTTHYEPDFDRLRDASTRIVMAAGVASEGEMAHRGAEAVAARLGTNVVPFPSDHSGFLGGEYGQTGEPAAFAAKLREVLAVREDLAGR
jgi:pimeloyl-ACP methyl ester carboxylesterase